MKKSLQMFLMVCAFAFSVLLVSAVESKAAVNMGVKQTDASSNMVRVAWNAYLGADHYHVELSYDGITWQDMEDSSSPDVWVNHLSKGASYYARVVAYKGSHYFGDHIKIEESEVVQVATSPAEPENLVQTGATNNTITMSWSPVAGATGYDVYAYINYDWTKVGSSNTTTATVNAIGNSQRFQYAIVARRAVTGGVADSNRSDSVYMKTIPAKVSYVAMTNYWHNLKEASYGWNSVNNADGYQFQLLNYKGKSLLTKETSGDYVYVSPFKQGVFTKARVRAYIVLNSKKIYGAWSNYTWNAANKKVTARRSGNRKKITINWKKISGCAGYTIYISTKSDSGFKKVKTLSSKKKSITIKKCGKKKLKKNKTYYYRVVYLTKVGKKKVASNVMGTGSI